MVEGKLEVTLNSNEDTIISNEEIYNRIKTYGHVVGGYEISELDINNSIITFIDTLTKNDYSIIKNKLDEYSKEYKFEYNYKII